MDRKYSTLVCIKAEYIYKKQDDEDGDDIEDEDDLYLPIHILTSLFWNFSFANPRRGLSLRLKEDVCGKEALRSITILL